MEHPSSPKSPSPSLQGSSPTSSPIESELVPISQELEVRKKKTRKKRKGDEDGDHSERKIKKTKKKKEGKVDRKQAKEQQDGFMEEGRKKARKQQRRGGPSSSDSKEQYSAAQIAVNEKMRRALEEDQYSAVGSIVDTDTDDDEPQYRTRGGAVRLDRQAILAAMRKRVWIERMNGAGSALMSSSGDDGEFERGDGSRGSRKKKRKKVSRRDKESEENVVSCEVVPGRDGLNGRTEDQRDDERDEGSIFGQTTGSSNATWVECDKCKKWRRLRGVVDEKKLPSKWYCSMNKNDPERARCSAPEEEYETPNTPESAADARTRKHLRVWVRRLESNENYEARQPTMTRGKKRSTITNTKEPYEWVRCCNPSCGKWRALLRCMDAKQNVIERTINGEWYCVMNTWDEKTASCAAPQENLPAIGCPPWVMQDEG